MSVNGFYTHQGFKKCVRGDVGGRGGDESRRGLFFFLCLPIKMGSTTFISLFFLFIFLFF